MKLLHTCQLAIALVVLCKTVRCVHGDTHGTIREDASEDVPTSPECAAVLLVGGGALGLGATSVLTSTVMPMILCSGGFCAAGVQAGSLASWWQSTIPLVSTGSIFAGLQSVAMSGGGASSATLALGTALGAFGGQSSLKQLCARIDQVDPTSPAGVAIKTNLKVYQDATRTYESVKPHVIKAYEDAKPHVIKAMSATYQAASWFVTSWLEATTFLLEEVHKDLADRRKQREAENQQEVRESEAERSAPRVQLQNDDLREL